ncbi:MAG: toll/interleukin-1 receptor domain-containing protein, partial [Bauldia sp.]
MAVWFLSHSSIDGEDARELKRRLEESPAAKAVGFRFWFDRTDLKPGPDLQKQLEQAIAETTDGFAVYIGSKGVINWVESELRLALTRATAGDYPFIPILAKGATVAQLPPFATRYLAVFDPLNDPEQMAKLLAAVTGGSGDGKPLAMVVDPFVGLRAMTEKESDRFFGRKSELEGLIEQLRHNRLVAIVADSGSGKSSLVQAGLVPRFRGGAFGDRKGLEPDDRIWHVVVMRPGASPAEGLRGALMTAAERLGLPSEEKSRLRGGVDFARPADLAYVLQCGLPAETTDTLFVVDQFEELFTQTPEEQRKPFIDWLMSLVEPGATLRFRVVLTIRNDYFNLTSAHPELFQRLRQESATLRLKQISEEGLAEIVNEPLKLAGHKDEAERNALIAQIRRDVSNRAGDLALVQMALFETWARRNEHGGDLLETYIAVGGVVGALANAAEEVRRAKLDPAERDMLESVLVRLVTLGDTGGATRRTASIEEYDATRQALIRKLATDGYGRLLLTSDRTVEICHEQLLTQWPWWQGCITRSAREV